MTEKKPILILLLIALITFQSNKPFQYNSIAYNNIRLVSNSHKGYYDTGELRYICQDHNTGATGRGTGVIQRFKFKRLYYDKCGNVKLIVFGTGETGCWRNDIKISKQSIKNKNAECKKELFIYPKENELMVDIKN